MSSWENNDDVLGRRIHGWFLKKYELQKSKSKVPRLKTTCVIVGSRVFQILKKKRLTCSDWLLRACVYFNCLTLIFIFWNTLPFTTRRLAQWMDHDLKVRGSTPAPPMLFYFFLFSFLYFIFIFFSIFFHFHFMFFTTYFTFNQNILWIHLGYFFTIYFVSYFIYFILNFLCLC